MREEDWKAIINELTEQLGQISLERAVAKADVKKALDIIAQKDKEIEALNKANETKGPEVFNITTKEQSVVA